MEKIVPWAELCGVIEHHYPKACNGRPPVGPERILRACFVQHADAACEDALLYSTALRRFAGIDLGPERVRFTGQTNPGQGAGRLAPLT